MNTVAIGAVLGVAILTASAYFVVEQMQGTDCIGEPMPGLAPAATTQHVRLTLFNDLKDEAIRVCFYAEDGTKLFDQELNAYGPVAQYWDLHLPKVVDHFVVDRPWPEHAELNGLIPYTNEAQCGRGKIPEFVYMDAEGSGGMIAAQCEGDDNHVPPREPAKQRLQTASMLPTNDERIYGGSGPLAFTAGLGVLLFLVIKFRTALHWAFIGLFTRILTPKVLDQSVRAQIHQLVQHQPGIRPVEIAQRLELAAGQTMHHLHVLVRAQALSLIRQGLARHYFVRGQYTPLRMQQLAALRTDSVARLQRAVQAHPGAPLSTLANLGGVSRPRASRIARRLLHVGLARAERHGKNLRLYPLPEWANTITQLHY